MTVNVIGVTDFLGKTGLEGFSLAAIGTNGAQEMDGGDEANGGDTGRYRRK